MSTALPPAADAPVAGVTPAAAAAAAEGNTADVKQAVVEKDVHAKPVKQVLEDITQQADEKKPRKPRPAAGKEVSPSVSYSAKIKRRD
jgi:hypothetical protein